MDSCHRSTCTIDGLPCKPIVARRSTRTASTTFSSASLEHLIAAPPITPDKDRATRCSAGKFHETSSEDSFPSNPRKNHSAAVKNEIHPACQIQVKQRLHLHTRSSSIQLRDLEIQLRPSLRLRRWCCQDNSIGSNCLVPKDNLPLATITLQRSHDPEPPQHQHVEA